VWQLSDVYADAANAADAPFSDRPRVNHAVHLHRSERIQVPALYAPTLVFGLVATILDGAYALMAFRVAALLTH
jgi:hypothetical protein